MKKMFLALAVLFGSYTIYAQNAVSITAEERADKTVSAIMSKVQVTADKEQDLKAVFTNFFKEANAYRKAGDNEKMQQAVKMRDERVKVLLADNEKYSEYQKLMREQK